MKVCQGRDDEWRRQLGDGGRGVRFHGNRLNGAEAAGMGVVQVARAAGLNRLRLSHAGFAWPQRLAT